MATLTVVTTLGMSVVFAVGLGGCGAVRKGSSDEAVVDVAASSASGSVKSGSLPPTRRISSASSGVSDVTDEIHYPAITAAPVSGTVKATLRFEFEHKPHRIAVVLDRSVVEGARRADRHIRMTQDALPSDATQRYDEALLHDPLQDPFYAVMSAQLRQLKTALRLDSDRWFELMMAMVQQIPYDPTPDRDARFPIETVADGFGDCDDKSRLLVALAAREGYAVALLHFDREEHTAVGIRANGLEYRNTGYALVESTQPSMVGFPFESHATVKLTTKPVVVAVGSGRTVFGAIPDVLFLRDTFSAIDAEQTVWQAQMKRLTDEMDALRDRTRTMEQQIRSGERQKLPADELRQRVEGFNDAVSAYNDAVSRQQHLARRINARIEIFNYIGANAATRYPTVQWVRARL